MTTKSPRWTIGIPCFDQPGTLWATITAIRCMHAEQMRDCEILVVNDNPRSKLGKLIAEEVPKMSGDDCRVRCVNTEGRSGTYSARNRVFDEALGDFVLCMDSHVLIALGGLASLFEYFAADPQSRDLVSGPVMYSSLKNAGTHYRDGFRGGMYGRWGVDTRANHRSPMNVPPGTLAFEIDAMGIGLFACRRDTFPRFHDAFRGFGGGEWYLHEKNRRQGGRSICLPDLRWPHYFWEESKAYKPVWYDRVRNEVIARQDLDSPIDVVYEHFVAGEKKYISKKDWDWLIADPIANEKPDCGGCGKKKAAASVPAAITGKVPPPAVQKPKPIGMEPAKLDPLTKFSFLCDQSGGKLSRFKADSDLTAWLELLDPAEVRFAVIPGTQAEVENDAGTLGTLRRFMLSRPEWSVLKHATDGEGLTVIGSWDRDKPKLPGTLTLVGNLAKAVAGYAASGMQDRTPEQVAECLKVCSLCELRRGVACSVCGCPVVDRARMASNPCPVGKWPN